MTRPAATTAVDGLCCAPIGAEALDEAQAIELAAVLKALAEPVRLRLVSIIAGDPSGEVCACDLPALVDRTQPTTSHHLSQLVKAGILDREQRGKWAWFRVRSERLDALAAVLASPTVHSVEVDSTSPE
jgi:ArsR family transcriptional regulator, arsenate/arsenite/antimonite-responsive transcriptional repressor